MAVTLNLGPVVDCFASESVTRTRKPTPTINAAGHAVQGSITTATINGAFQRPGPDALQRLSEGLRSRATWLMHTTADVRGASQASVGGRTAVMADLITYTGITYTVVDITGQTSQGNYRRVILLDGEA